MLRAPQGHWVRIANDIRDNYDDWDAFVILHGTGRPTDALACAPVDDSRARAHRHHVLHGVGAVVHVCLPGQNNHFDWQRRAAGARAE